MFPDKSVSNQDISIHSHIHLRNYTGILEDKNLFVTCLKTHGMENHEVYKAPASFLAVHLTDLGDISNLADHETVNTYTKKQQ